MKKKFLFLPFLIASLFISSCTCHEYVELADLLSTSGISNPGTISTGQSYDFNMPAKNKAAEKPSKNECPTTEITKATLFYANLIKDGIMIINGTKDMPGLDPDAIANLSRNILFEQPGNYTLEYFLDYPNTVNERNENNQNYYWYEKSPNPEFKLEEMRKTNNYYKITFVVKENPNYHPKDLSVFAKFTD